MSNMSYCRFQNTAKDMRECVETLDEDSTLAELRGDELRSAIHMIKMCRDVAEQFEGIDLEKLWRDHN